MISRGLLIWSLLPEQKWSQVSLSGTISLDTSVLTIGTEPSMAPWTLAKLQDPLKKSLETAQKDLLPMYRALGKYSKALDKVRHPPCFPLLATPTDRQI